VAAIVLQRDDRGQVARVVDCGADRVDERAGVDGAVKDRRDPLAGVEGVGLGRFEVRGGGDLILGEDFDAGDHASLIGEPTITMPKSLRSG
jgi:hypothetical protein